MKKNIAILLMTAILLSVCGPGVTALAAGEDLLALTVDVTADYDGGRAMLEMINGFRTGSEANYKLMGGGTMDLTGQLQPLSYSSTLTEIAMQRAAEAALSFSHTRPDGTSCRTASASGVVSYGENLSAGYGAAESTFLGWREDDNPAGGQGHRINMLGNYTAVGIGHVIYQGVDFWVQEFGYAADDTGAAGSAERTFTVMVSPEYIVSCREARTETESVTLQSGDVFRGGSVQAVVSLKNAFYTTASLAVTPEWCSADESILSPGADGSFLAKDPGETELTGAVFGQTVTIHVAVEKEPSGQTPEPVEEPSQTPAEEPTPSGESVPAPTGDTNSCTVTLNANGSYFDGDVSKTTRTDTAPAGTAILVQAPQSSSEHLSFKGWYLDENGTQPADMLSPNSILVTGEVTLYAGWEEACILTFDPCEGQLYGVGGSYSVSVRKGTQYYNFPIPSVQNENLVFANQWLLPDGTALGMRDSLTVNEDITLRAKYTEAWKIDLILDDGTVMNTRLPKGGKIGDLYLDAYAKAQTWYSDEQHTQPIPAFLFLVPEGDATYYGVLDSCQVTMIYGSNENDKNVSTVKKGSSLINGVGGFGSQFMGMYFLDRDYTIPIDPTSFTVTEDITIYVRDLSETVTLTIDLDGGRYLSGQDSSLELQVRKGCSALREAGEPVNAESYSKEGYAFLGFSTKKGGPVDIDLERTAFQEDTTIYAVWSEGCSLTLDFNGQIAVSGSSLVSSVSIICPVGTALNEYLPDSQKYRTGQGSEGPIIQGWYLDSACTRAVPENALLSADITVYAKWCERPVLITINDNANRNLIYNTSIQVAPGESVDLIQSVIPYSPCLELVLTGFSLDKEGRQPVDARDFRPTANVTVYAQWATGTTVFLSGNGRDFGPDRQASVRLQLKTGEAIGEGYDSMTDMDGHTVAGWYFDPQLTRLAAETLAGYTPAGNVTLYAKWSETVAPTAPATPAILQGRSLLIEGKVGVTFYLELPESFLNDTGACVKINGTAMPLPAPDADAGWYKFTYYVAAKEMRDAVTIQLFDGRGNPYPTRVKEGADCTAGYEFSAQAYFDLAHDKSSDQELLTMLDRMSEYGAFAQLYFKHNTTMAQVADAARPGLSVVTEDALAACADSITTAEGLAISHEGTSLLLESETSIKHRFRLTGGSIGEYSFYVDGQLREPVDEGNGFWAVIIPNIAAKNLDQSFRVEVKKGDQTVITVDNYSALSWVRRVVRANGGGDPAILELADSMYLYNQSANAYFG